jgi:hypothetical protein
MLSLFLLSSLLSLLLNSFRFLLKPGGDDSIGAVRRSMLDSPVQAGAGRRLPDLQVLTRTFWDAQYTARSIALTQVQHRSTAWQRLMAAQRRPAHYYVAIALKLVGGVF